MSQEVKKPFPDPFVRQGLFPNPAAIFDFAPASLSAAIREGIVVVDTNVLLVPYTTGKASLEQIRQTYHRLVSEGRLRIPGQVAREFAEHRAEKLKMLFQQLSRKRSVNLELSQYPLLEDVTAYFEMRRCEDEISSKLEDYRKLIGSLLDSVEKWRWDDPVSKIYRDLFKESVFVDPAFDRDELLKELKYRQEHRIPPGYKDAGNEYSGVGDLLIWKTILEIGERESRDVVFVSGDEKSDWRYQSENRALYPRYELLDEYRRKSKNKSLIVISFAELLQHLGVPAPVVSEVKREESFSWLSDQLEIKVNQRRAHVAEQAVLDWIGVQNPNANIRPGTHGFPDFVVDEIRAYQVKYLRAASAGARRLREMLALAKAYVMVKHMPVTIVFAADQVETANALTEIALRASQAPGQLVSGEVPIEIVVGIISSDGRFIPNSRHQIDDRADHALRGANI